MSNLKQNSMARRHALFLRVPCPFSKRHAPFFSAMRSKCALSYPNSITSNATLLSWHLRHMFWCMVLPKWRVPRTHPNYPCTQLLNLQSVTLLIEGSHLTRGGVNASPITPGRTLPWPTFIDLNRPSVFTEQFTYQFCTYDRKGF